MDTRTSSQTISADTNPAAQYRESWRWLFSFAPSQPTSADAYQASKLNLEMCDGILRARVGTMSSGNGRRADGGPIAYRASDKDGASAEK